MARLPRSEMSIEECHAAVQVFSRNIQRMGVTSGGGMFSQFAPDDQIGIHLLITGTFHSPDRWFEAMHILAGKKSAKKTGTLAQGGWYKPADILAREVLLSECFGQGSGPGWRLMAPLIKGMRPVHSLDDVSKQLRDAYAHLLKRKMASIEVEDEILRIRLLERKP